jgi:hypothetical protein
MAEAAAQDERPKVIYVMGTGRSGSTIFGVTLGNCDDIFCAGELHLWIGKAGKAPLAGVDREAFWNAVRGEVSADLSGPQARSLEQSTAALHIGARRARRALRPRYRRIAEDLFRAVARTAGTRYIVDTSHFPRRARELQSLPGIDLYLILLVRDPQGIVASYSRDDEVFPTFNVFTTNAYLWLTYLLSVWVFLRQPRDRRLLVRYESFIADPEGVLNDIFEAIGSSAAPPDLTALKTGLVFQGNPVLKSDVVELKRQPPKPGRRSLATTLIQLPWLALSSLLRPAARSAPAPPAESSVPGSER